MKPFERYLQLKKIADEKNVESSALNQYLHIAQVMNVEGESYSRHKKHMNEWLKNIENDILKQIKESDNHGNDK